MKETKEVFIGLLLLALSILIVLVGGVLYLNFFGFNLLSSGVLIVITIILSVLTLILILGILGIVLTMKSGRPVKILVLPTKLVISYFVPVVIALGGVLGWDKELVQASFIEVSNKLINPEDLKLKGEDILLLVPHCIQLADCAFRVTSSLDNCQHCGGCQVDDLIELKKRYNIHLAIATGGTLARKIIKEIRPKVIIAVACERDLSSGIQDIYPLPVFGVINLRPYGPCFNTEVEVKQVEEAIRKIIGN